MPISASAGAPRAVAQEHLILVGAPSNTFNGYESYTPTRTPAPAPANAGNAEIHKYLHGPPPRATHDLYWANFLFAAVKLIEYGHARPAPGDILTFVVYYPGYELRDARDWEASPYNPRHRNSLWVTGAFPYNRTVRADEQRPPPGLNNPIDSQTPPVQAPPSTAEAVIDHEILMRTTGELLPDGRPMMDGGYPKRLRKRWDIVRALHDVPLRITQPQMSAAWANAAPLKHVQVKLLLLRDDATAGQQFLDYLTTGTWTGARWKHPLSFLSGEQGQQLYPPPEGVNWISNVNPVAYRHPDWSAAPSVNRARVKVRRFDYFGHAGGSGTEGWFLLRYGWSNAKGVAANGEHPYISATDLEAALAAASANPFTPDAAVYLWGCFQAVALAPLLAEYARTVQACENATSYSTVLDDANPSALPAPGPSGWKTFTRTGSP